MSLQPGTRLGPYEIVAAIGAGGMGEVYRATDGNLKRSVAIKVLPALVAGDPDRLARFQREAEVLAALNHPNIAGVFGLERTADQTALVMELVDGEDLSAHVARGPIPVPEAIAIAKQIADALEAAHERGIVHRDLKPANIKIRADGTVKVLDFGLAKALAPDAASATAEAVANSPTLTARATQAGMILGTAAYMAPEQARGKPVDRRADVWAFGCVLYEMLTNTRAFPGDDVTDVLAAVVRADPDWSLLPADLSPTLQIFLRRCLQKDAKQRVGDIHDVRLALDGAFDTPAVAAASAPVAVPPRPMWRRALPIAAASVVTAAIAAGAMWLARPAPTARVVSRFVVPFGEGQERRNAQNRGLAISPDGTTIAYIASDQLYLRAIGDFDARQLQRTIVFAGLGPREPVFSPDGRQIAYMDRENDKLAVRSVDLAGGAPVTIAADVATLLQPPYLEWHGDHVYVAGASTPGIMRIPASAGQAELVVPLAKGEIASRPQVLEDGRLLFAVTSTGATTTGLDWSASEIVVQRPGEATRTKIAEGGTDPRYLPSGHLIYQLNGVLYARTFDLSSLVVGSAVPVVEGVFRGVFGFNAWYAVSQSGTLVYLPGPVSRGAAEEYSLALFDRTGKSETLPVPAGPYSEPRISPDGRRIAFGRSDSRETSIWVYDLGAGTSARRLTSGGHDRFPVWSHDSQRVIFQSDREGDLGLFWQRADGTGTAERLTRPAKGVAHIPQSASRDGAVLLVDETVDVKTTLMTFRFKEKSMTPFGDVVSGRSTGAVFSPDGRRVAYSIAGAVAGSDVLYEQLFPPTGEKTQVSTSNEDGHHPAWSSDGKELFYNAGPGSRLGAVTVMASPGFAFGPAPPAIKAFASGSSVIQRTYDVLPDGKGFLGFSAAAQSAGRFVAGTRPELRVVLNWPEELRMRAPNGK